MSKTNIEWTHRPGTIGEVWNLTTGCNKVDRGCKHCYAEVMHNRLLRMQPAKYNQPFLAGAVEHRELLDLPMSWKRPRTVFVDSMSDLFHVNVSFGFIRQAFDVMEECKQHTYLILTKRPERLLAFQDHMQAQVDDWRCPPHVWVGTSVNDQDSADLRVPRLLQFGCDTRFVSYEPATGPVNFRAIKIGPYRLDALAGELYDPEYRSRFGFHHPKLHWVIAGGESGHKAVPAHPDWFRVVREDCRIARVPWFFKQWGHWEPVSYNREGILFVSYTVGKNEFVFGEPYRPQNMRKAAHKNGNLLDGVTHLNFPNR